jgi:uncharacterized protein CbrC (UPF0167 family)
MNLPTFTYHPDPLATGSVEPSKEPCIACGRARGFIYTGPAYAAEELDGGFCPWCIADGSAHAKFDLEFVDQAGVGGNGSWPAVPASVVEEIAFRTPGFCGWQQERWWTHCGDAAEFLGPVGRDGAIRAGAAFLDAIRAAAGLARDADWKDYLAALDRDRGPTAYVFRCRVCGALGGYSDSR